MPEAPGVIIGTLMARKRENELFNRGMLHEAMLDGVCYVRLRMDRHPAESVIINSLLLKATDYLDDDGVACEYSEAVRKYLRALRKRGIPIIEDFEQVDFVRDRLNVHNWLHDLVHATNGQASRCPAAVARSALELEHISASLPRSDALLVKPAVACGVDRAHEMTLVLCRDKLIESVHSYPVVIEAYCNHGARQLKCYVIGDSTYVVVKASIPDIHAGTVCEDGKRFRLGERDWCTDTPYAWRFHSLHGMPKGASPEGEAMRPSVDEEALMESIAAYIRGVTGLRLFGFDVVRCHGQAGYTVIDVNAFPSYSGLGLGYSRAGSMPDLAATLRRFLKANAAG